MKFITLEQAKLYARIDNDDEDSLIELMIEAASQSVYDYIKGSNPDFFDEDNFPIEDSAGVAIGLPKNVVSATGILFSYLYKDRDNNGLYKVNSQGNFEHGFMPLPVISMLYRWRRMGLA